MQKIKAFFSRARAAKFGAAATLTTLLVGAAPAFASAQTAPTTTVPTPDLVTGGTSGLSSGVSVLVSFLYSALPIVLGLAVAAAIVGWVIRKIGRGAH